MDFVLPNISSFHACFRYALLEQRIYDVRETISQVTNMVAQKDDDPLIPTTQNHIDSNKN